MLPPCKLFGLRGHGLGVCRLYGRAKGDLQKDLCHRMPPRTAAANAPVHSRPLLTHVSAGDPQMLTGWSGSVSCGVMALLPWVLVHIRLCLCPPRFSGGYGV